MNTEEHFSTAFEAPDPDFAARVRASFARQRIMGLLGAELARIEPGFCEIQLPFKDALCQQHGFFHGGVIGTIADSAGGYAAFSLMPAEASVLTTEFKINLLAPAEGELLRASGRVIRPGRLLTVCEVDVFALKDGAAKPCAKLLETLMCLEGRPDGPASG